MRMPCNPYIIWNIVVALKTFCPHFPDDTIRNDEYIVLRRTTEWGERPNDLHQMNEKMMTKFTDFKFEWFDQQKREKNNIDTSFQYWVWFVYSTNTYIGSSIDKISTKLENFWTRKLNQWVEITKFILRLLNVWNWLKKQQQQFKWESTHWFMLT